VPKRRIEYYNFPYELAKQVSDRWEHFIGGEYTCPPSPSKLQLRSLLEVAYLAGLEKEEGRSLRFTLCCTPQTETVQRQYSEDIIDAWSFAENRPFTIQEIRRLAAATDIDTSAIWIWFPQDPNEKLLIHGLLNLGSSWSNARKAFAYHYDRLPDALLARVEAPGWITVYQGNYSIASLRSGQVHSELTHSSFDTLGVHSLFKEGLGLIEKEIIRPKYEYPRDYYEFEWLAYVNTILAVVNSIQLSGHGGALIFSGKNCKLTQRKGNVVRIKYRLSSGSDHLRKQFVKFINQRHKFSDMISLLEREDKPEEVPTEDQVKLGDKMAKETEESLAESCIFVGNLAGVDGALILRTDLSVEGFGAEILLDKVKHTKVYQVTDVLARDKVEYDSEQRGTRHRSAVRLCATVSDLVAFIVSQDGGVSLAWKDDDGDICFKAGIRTTNANMIGA
jgi:hypothetical protein